jgi:SPP1 gp7 family putative phage head morphogenesis protein
MRSRRPVRDRKPGERSFVQTRKVERFYAAQLRKIARQIGELIKGSPLGSIAEANSVAERLAKYGELIEPWATSVAETMVADVNRADRSVWQARSADMGRLLERELREAPTGAFYRETMARQVALIKSLPVEAGERIQGLVTEALTTGRRASEIAEEIARSGDVAASRASTIARTEVSTASSTLTEARAVNVGSVGYIWRTAHDSDVRPSHKAMEGKFVAWASPPTLDGMTGHAGRFPNCRCYPEPVLPDLE